MPHILHEMAQSKSLSVSSTCVYVCSVVSDSATPWTVAHQIPLSVEFPRQEYWNGLPFPPPGDLPDPGIEPVFLALAGGFFTLHGPFPLVNDLVINSVEYHIYQAQANVESNYTTHYIITILAFIKEFPFKW